MRYLILVLASAILPLAKVTATRQREAELRRALREIRTAIDKFKDAADAQQIGSLEIKAGSEGYPADLQVLVDGVAVSGCLLPARLAEGATITTVEGLAAEELTPRPWYQGAYPLDASRFGEVVDSFGTSATGTIYAAKPSSSGSSNGPGRQSCGPKRSAPRVAKRCATSSCCSDSTLMA